MKLNEFPSRSDFTLTFLRPAPPKMSIRPSQLRKHLFPEYQSVPPPVDDMRILENKSAKKRSTIDSKKPSSEINELIKPGSLKSTLSEKEASEEGDEDEDESDAEDMLILAK